MFEELDAIQALKLVPTPIEQLVKSHLHLFLLMSNILSAQMLGTRGPSSVRTDTIGF